MTDARSYSVTPRTICIRYEDGKRQVLLLSAPVVNGVGGFLMCSSVRLESNRFGWHRKWEHPQEWTDCG